MYAPFIGAGFACLLSLDLTISYYAKAVTITNGVYTMLGAVANSKSSIAIFLPGIFMLNIHV